MSDSNSNQNDQELTLDNLHLAGLPPTADAANLSPAIVGRLTAELIYIMEGSGTFYSTHYKIEMSNTSVNMTYQRHFNQRDTPSAYLKQHPELIKVARRAWLPYPYRPRTNTASDMVEPDQNGVLCLNTFEYLSHPTPAPAALPPTPWLGLLSHLVPHEGYREALTWYLAHIVQRPQVKMTWNPIILGIEGAGKDSLLKPIANIIPTCSCSTKNFDSSYEDYLYETKLLVINESAGFNRRLVEQYKKLTGGENSATMRINPKGKGEVKQLDVLNVVMLSNHLGAMQISKNDRRCFVLNAQVKMPPDLQHEYYGWLSKPNAVPDLMRYLLDYPLDSYPFSPYNLPHRTEWVEDMIEAAMSDFEAEVIRVVEGLDAILPELLVPYMRSQGHNHGSVKKDIMAVLHANNWVKWVTYFDKGVPPQKKINGVIQYQARGWLVRKDKIDLYENHVDMFELCDKVQAYLGQMLKNSGKY